MSDIICCNCGKKGHKYKECKNPVTSYGIICLNYNNEDLKQLIDSANQSKYSNIMESSNYIELVDKLKNDLKILMICRKDTIGYIELIRGNYNINNPEYIKELISYMSHKEKQKLLKNINRFDYLWIKLWSLDHQNVDCRRIENEYAKAKAKFEKLRNEYNLENIIQKCSSDWSGPEWGFPKGRREMKESDIESARREFEEESGFNFDEYEVLNIKPIYENFRGCNGINYRHIYYVAQSKKKNIQFSQNNIHHATEISAIQWVSYKQAMDLIRSYHIEKKKSLKYLFNLIKNILMNAE